MLGNVAADRQRRPGAHRERLWRWASAWPGSCCGSTSASRAWRPPRWPPASPTLWAGTRSGGRRHVLAPRARPSGGPGPAGRLPRAASCTSRVLDCAVALRLGAAAAEAQAWPDESAPHGPAATASQLRCLRQLARPALVGAQQRRVAEIALDRRGQGTRHRAPARAGRCRRRCSAALVSVAITAMPAAMPSSTTLGMASVTAGNTMIAGIAERPRRARSRPSRPAEADLRLDPQGLAELSSSASRSGPSPATVSRSSRMARGERCARPRTGYRHLCARSAGRRRRSWLGRILPRGWKKSRIDTIRQDADGQLRRRRLRHRSQRGAHREHTCRVAPDPPGEMAEKKGIQPTQTAIVAGHVRAAQGDDDRVAGHAATSRPIPRAAPTSSGTGRTAPPGPAAAPAARRQPSSAAVRPAARS